MALPSYIPSQCGIQTGATRDCDGAQPMSAAYLHPGFQNPKWCVALTLAQDDIARVLAQPDAVTYLRKGSPFAPSHLLTIY